MKLRTWFIHTAVLLSTALTLPAFQAKPAAPTSGPGEKKGSISGTVLDAVAGKSVKDVTLLLVNSAGAGKPATTKSGEAGEFTFRDLDAGSYILMGDHPRYARQTYGSRNGLMGGSPLTISAGQEMREITFKVQPNAVASGRVLDEDGEPLQGVLVTPLKGMYHQGRRQHIPVGSAMSNDLGEYRIANLAAGTYVLSATLMRPGQSPAPAADQPEETYITTYYPNATVVSAAAPVEVTVGADMGGMDIKLAKARSVRVSGKVIGLAKDQKVSVRLIPKGAGFLAMITGKNAVVKPDGTFEIAGAIPGSYVLRANDARGMKPLSAGVPIEVGDKRIEDAVLEIATGAELAGAVVVEAGEQVPMKGARLILEATEGLNMAPPNTMVAEDGTFTLKDVPADRYFVRLINGPQGSWVSSVQLGNQKMDDQGLDLSHAGTGKLEVKLRLGGAQVDGVITGQDDKPLSGVTVALIPNSRKYLLYQSTFTDQQGAFSFKGVTPGDYKLLSWEQVEPGAFQDPEFLKPFESKAESVSLKENDSKAVKMKAIPR
ncbi:MAG TPA: carboxypeptidase-like regulatory domain-containing protein [Bryobacteraceae bacterium]|nr:carboxypeptidase-like regulatory domain-containing protein [Bryobacteraceae bacterium]